MCLEYGLLFQVGTALTVSKGHWLPPPPPRSIYWMFLLFFWQYTWHHDCFVSHLTPQYFFFILAQSFFSNQFFFDNNALKMLILNMCATCHAFGLVVVGLRRKQAFATPPFFCFSHSPESESAFPCHELDTLCLSQQMHLFAWLPAQILAILDLPCCTFSIRIPSSPAFNSASPQGTHWSQQHSWQWWKMVGKALPPTRLFLLYDGSDGFPVGLPGRAIHLDPVRSGSMHGHGPMHSGTGGKWQTSPSICHLTFW